MSAEKVFQGLPSWARGVIALAVTAGVVFAGYKGYQYVQASNKRRSDEAETNAASLELKKLNEAAATKQKLSASQLTTMANQIHEAMDGYGTNSSAVGKQLLQLSNQADWLALSKAYGVRTISSGKLNPTPDFKGTLMPSLVSEFGVLDEMFLPMINGTFRKRGINAII
jgi:hypothetical protein